MNAIEVRNVSKHFRIPHERRTTLAERLTGLFRTNQVEILAALSDVSLAIPSGSFVGIIGANGSGKSTLLKLMAGLLVPDDGQVRVHGTLVPLLELGLGFQQELTVRENVELYGAVLGYTPAAMGSKVDEVIAFAGLERFRDAKLKSLSSGMMVRLAFSTALRADADTLLLDEIMAVGDAQFQRKCMEVFQGLKRQRKTIVLVSHDLASVQRFCDHVYWLDKGRVAMGGDASEVIQTYLAVRQPASGDEPSIESAEGMEHRWGDGQVRFTEVTLTDEHGRPVTQVTSWTRLVLHATVVANAAVESPVFGMLIWLAGQLVYSVNTRWLGIETGPLRPGERRRLDIQFTPALGNGHYRVSMGVAAETDGSTYDWLNHAAAFLVVGARCGDGVCDLGTEFDCHGAPQEVGATPPGGSRA
jgi:homopolymeric O-antigen transport system ATP-binding protein